MATSVGAQGAAMIGVESVYGTAVTPTRVIPFVSENIQRVPDFIESKALRSDAPRILTQTQFASGKVDPKGPLAVEVYNKGFGMFLKWPLGTVAITQPSAGPDPTVYDQTFSSAASLAVQMMTLEIGWNDLAGSPFSKTISGAMVDKFSLSGKVGELVQASFDVVGSAFTVATSKTTPTYAAGLTPFSWAGGSLTLGGASADISSLQIDVNNNLDADRFYLGSATRKQPLAPQMLITGSADGDFSDWTAYNRFLNGTFATLVCNFDGATISNSYKFGLQVTMNVRTDGDTPSLSGPGRIGNPLKFTAFDSGSGPSSALSVRYRTTDSSV